MSFDLFDRNAYTLLGFDLDGATADVKFAFAKAQAAKSKTRIDPKRLADARDALGKFARRLSLDAFVVLPPVNDALLDSMASTIEGSVDLPSTDPIFALLAVPEIEFSPKPELTAFEPRAELYASEPLLVPEIDR